MIEVRETDLEGVLLIETKQFNDDRGFFLETYNAGKYKDAGLKEDFVQDNCSHSKKGALRGLHYQVNKPQGKLVSALKGEIFDVAVDIRKESKTFGKWYGAVLSDKNRKQLYVPVGFAHGFLVLSDEADVTYKCTELYSPQDERSLIWSDEEIGIEWPKGATPILSEKDELAPKLSKVKEEDLF